MAAQKYWNTTGKLRDKMGFHRIAEWSRLEGTSGGHVVQPPSSSRAT